MAAETGSTGARRIVEMLAGGDRIVRWSRPVLRIWGFLFVGLVLLAVWLPIRGTPAAFPVLVWTAVYTVYLLILEVLHIKAKQRYESPPFQLFRIHFNLVMTTALMLAAPATASSYLWFFFSMPILAMLLYFGRLVSLSVVYLEVCTALLIVTLVQDRSTSLGLAVMVAQDAILGLLAVVLYFFVRFFPRRREESALLEAATALIRLLDQEGLAQLLADAAKAAVPAADAAVVHLLGGEENQTLLPRGSSDLDLTTLGRSLMEIGVGVAGHAMQNRETINVPDVNEDARYLQLHPSFTPFRSLLVAPMYVGDKNVGTISVHSARKEAFDQGDERFLTMLAAQGATAIANAELYDTHTRRRQQLSLVLEASRTFGLNRPLDTLLETIATEVCRCSGYRMAVVNLMDETSRQIIIRAMAGVPPEGQRRLEGARIPLGVVTPLLREEFRISQSYFIRHDRCPMIADLSQYTFTPDLGKRKVGEWHQEDILIVPIQTREQELLGYISVDDPIDRRLPSLDIVQALEILASVAATAIKNAYLYEDQQRRAAQLALISDIGGKIASVLDLDSVLDRATHLMQESFGYHHVALFTLDREQGELVMRARAGSFAALFPPDHRIRLGQGMVGWVGCHSRTLLANDVQAEPSYVNFFPDLIPTRSELSVPVRVGEEIVGVLDVQSPQLNAFDENSVIVMETLADQVAVAIANARLYEAVHQELTERGRAEEALRQRNRELEVLNLAGQAFGSTLDLDQVLITVLEELRRLLYVTASSVWLIDSETGELVCRQATGSRREVVRGWCLAPGQGIAGWVARCGESVIVPDARADERHFRGVDEQTGLALRSILCVPMRVKEDVIGVLQVVDTQANRFQPTDLPSVESLAATAAIAIENARLYEETDRLRLFNENIVQSMEEGILIEDANARITFVNRRTAQLLRYAPEELVGQRCTVIVAPEEVTRIEEGLAQWSRGIADRYETVLLTKGGQHVPVIVSATPLFEQGVFTGALCVCTDITDRKRQETRLQEYLSTVTNSLALYTSLEGLYKFVVEAGTKFLSAHDCSLFLVSDEDSGTMELAATVTVSSPQVDKPHSPIGIGPDSRLVVHVAAMRQPVRMLGKEIVQHPSWSEEPWRGLEWDFDAEADHSLLAAPLCLPDGSLVGVLVARDAEGRGGFSDFDEVLIRTLATNAAADIERVRGLEKARQDAVRAERKRLETDLHEAMNVLVTGVQWEAEILSDEIQSDHLTAAGVALTRLQAALARAYTDLRTMLEDLRDPTLEQKGLLAALKSRAELVGHGNIVVYGDLQERLPADLEGMLYRVGQEAMINAVKHSGLVRNPDVRIELWLERSGGQVRLWTRDNGDGFDVESTLALSDKWGLRRLRDIVHEQGGELVIDSVPGQGTTICAAVDLAGMRGKKSAVAPI